MPSKAFSDYLFNSYNLLLVVLQLWFVLTVPEDFKLLHWIYSCWMLTYTSVSISHGGDKGLQTCERYAPAEMSVLLELH